jgi:hypothetical protein
MYPINSLRIEKATETGQHMVGSTLKGLGVRASVSIWFHDILPYSQ